MYAVWLGSDLLRGYHDRLCAEGVTGYDFDRFRGDYARAVLACFQTLSTSDEVDVGEDRGAVMMELWMERLLARVRRLDPTSLL